MTQWVASASSVEKLGRAGFYTFTAPSPVEGLVVGLCEEDKSPARYEAPFSVEFAGGNAWAVSAGVRVKELGAGDRVLHLVRVGTRVLVCRGSEPTEEPGVPFLLPGRMVHAFAQRFEAVKCVLDAAVKGFDDTIEDASITSYDQGVIEAIAKPGLVYGGDPHSIVLAEALPGEVLAGPLPGCIATALPGVAVIMEFAGDAVMATALPGEVLAVEAERVNVGTAYALPGQAVGSDYTSDAIVAVAPLGFVTAYGYPSDPVGIDMAVPVPLFAEADPPLGDLIETSDFVLESEPLDDGVFMVNSDVVLEGDGLPSRVAATLMVESVVRMADNPIIGGGLTPASDLVLDSEAFTSYTLLVTDDLVLDSEPSAAVGSVRELVVDSAFVLDSEPTTVFALLVEDEVVLDDGFTVYADAVEASEFVMDDAAIVTGTAPLLLVEDVLLLAGEPDGMQTVAAALVVEDELVLVDEPLVRGLGLMAWVMNTETTGVSWYENWPFTGMALTSEGVLLAIGPEGLAVVDGDTDDGADIDADIELGYTDFSGYTQSGAPKNEQWAKQRVLSFWVGYTADGVLDAAVQTHGNRTYRYKLERRDAHTPRNSRIKPGKGLNERFWRVNFGNTCGCSFAINSLAAEVVASTRRI